MFKSKKRKEAEAKAKAEKEAKKGIEVEINLEDLCQKPLAKIDVVNQQVNGGSTKTHFHVFIGDEYEMCMSEEQFEALASEIYKICPPTIERVVYSVERPTGAKYTVGEARLSKYEEPSPIEPPINNKQSIIQFGKLVDFLNEHGMPLGELIRKSHEK